MIKTNTSQTFIFILITTFLGVMGIGLVIPELAFIVAKFVKAGDNAAIAFHVGLLTSIYSVCQFFAAPVLGALSDKYGRRPVLLMCQFGSAIGYITFGAAGGLWLLYIGRVIDGLTGGDISTIFAYMADITKPEDRGKNYGIVGATVGVGFILGPSIGGLLSTINLSAPFYLAAAITLLNMAFGYFVLPESLDKKHRTSDFSWHHLNPWVQIQYAMSKPALKTILIIGIFYFIPFAQLQGISSVFLKDVMHFSPANIGLLFLLIGIFDIITQGFLSGKLMPKFGRENLVMAGLALTGVSYTLNTLLPAYPLLAISIPATIIYAFGSGFFEPAYGAMVSHTGDARDQGRVQGASQAMQAVTRIIGPIIALTLYPFHTNLPYVTCVILSLIGVYVVYRLKK
jgi:DHA1 family tetracycline resistance protein-like MFS transporter